MLLSYFSTFGGVASLNVIVTEFILSNCKVEKRWLKQLISWTCPILLSILGFVLGWGIFAPYGTITSVSGWVYTILTGVGLGLSSNGIYEMDIVKNAIPQIKEFLSNLKINK